MDDEDLPSRADHTLTLGADHEILDRELIQGRRPALVLAPPTQALDFVMDLR